MTFVVAAALTWRKWPDVLIDYGTQLYIPWRILNGSVLYRDLFYFGGGPLAQYFNALLFKIFGVSFSTLIAANIIFTAGIVLLIYRRFWAAADAWTATIIGTGVVIIFAFAEFTPIGNYNYITPYSYEATYGLMLSTLVVALLADWVGKQRTWIAPVAGFCTGLVFLTKPDVFLALAVAVTAAFIFFWLRHGQKKFLKSLLVFLAAGVIPTFFFFLYFLRSQGAAESIRLTFFDWIPLLQGTVTKSPFYQWCMGLDKPLANLENIGIYFGAVVVVVTVYSFVLRWLRNLKWAPLQYIALLVLISPLLLWAIKFGWIQCGWPLPLLCLSACVLIIWNYKKLEQPVFPLLWSMFGFALLAKLGLFPRIWHYGFALAMPAFVSSIYLLFWLLPRLLETKFQVPARLFRIMIGLILLVGFVSLFNGSQSIYAQKTLPVGTDGDTMLTYSPNTDKSQAIYAALAWTEKYMPTNATLAVLPEGVTLNYLTRHVNPSGGLDWNPTMFTVFGQQTMTDAFEKNPPDYVFIVEWDSSDFGVGYFGSSPDYGQGLMQWIQKNYRMTLLIGNEPLKNGLFGIKILKHMPVR